jgi:hypothetical protein
MDSNIAPAITAAVTGTAADVTGLIVDNLPVALGVSAAFVGLGFARRLVRSLGS